MDLAVTEGELHTLLSEVAFTRQYGFRLHAIGDGECTLEVPFQEMFERPGARVSGQVFMAAADVAMWLAIKSRLGMAHDALTSDLNTVFLSPAKTKVVYCTARILKAGTRRFFGTAECHDNAGKVFTHHTLTNVRVS